MREYILDPLRRLIRNPAFVVCSVILGICAASLQIAAEKLQWHFRKLPLPLRLPLDQINPKKIEPYRIISTQRISEEIESELGTKDYLYAKVENQQVDIKDPLRYMTLFITYYTGNPDKVPHVPDVCYVGGGGQVKDARNTLFKVADGGAENDEVPVRILNITMPGLMGRAEQQVFYFFAVNGTYRCTRDAVRILQHNLYDSYAYFSKVEISFPSAGSESEANQFAAAEKLIQTVLPVLYHDHWPDWEAANQQAATP